MMDSLMFDPLKREIAGSQVTLKLLIFSDDGGKMIHLQMRWEIRSQLCVPLLRQTVWKRKFHSCMGTAENAVLQV